MLYLHDDDASLKATAVDLSSRGFHIWQQYIDATTMLRSLVSLATSTRKENIAANVGPQARQAVLNIVTHHTGLFMTTISIDIMNPRDVEQRRSVMQLVAFLIRKVNCISKGYTTFYSYIFLAAAFDIPKPSTLNRGGGEVVRPKPQLRS